MAISQEKLRSVIWDGKPNLTSRDLRRTTLRRMDETWRHLDYQWERLRWARLRAGFERSKDAAESLNVKPGTYRNYEHSKADGGREPPLVEIQRMARKFKASWVWIASGQGSPDDDVEDERLTLVMQKAKAIPPEKQEDAYNAVLGVLEAYRKRG